jgi:hypothetical protein
VFGTSDQGVMMAEGTSARRHFRSAITTVYLKKAQIGMLLVYFSLARIAHSGSTICDCDTFKQRLS